MRFFLRRRIPHISRVLVVESGGRDITERLIPSLRRSFGDSVEIDVVTCYAGVPAGLENGVVYRTGDYQGAAGRRRLYAELRERGFAVAAIVCSAQPIMTKWKWALAWKLPVKLLIVNENADYFWFDRGNWRIVGHFALFRAGLAGPGAVRAVARLCLFPFTFLYLLLYAAAVHLRRAVWAAIR